MKNYGNTENKYIRNEGGTDGRYRFKKYGSFKRFTI